MTLEREELRDDWTVTMTDGTGAPDGVAGRAIPATVPGQVHTDLEREGLLPDPTFHLNEQAAKWVGRADWAYRRTVDVDPRGHERVDLVCDGLDTVAELTLDGVVVGTTRNMHRRYRFDARVQTGSGGTTKDLEILFESPYREAGRVAAKAGSMPGPYDEPFPYVRKMASNFGWDWGLTAVTSGPWRPVAIERWSTARLREVRPLVDVEAGEGVLDAHITVERSGMNDLDQDGEDDDLVLVVTVSGDTEDGGTTRQRSRAQLTPKDDETVVTVRVPEARRWWPRGYGAQPQYDVVVELQTVDGEVLDRDTFRTGFRSTRIETQVDGIGRPFAVHVNGTLIDVRGVNWIPDDVIVSRVDRARLESRLGAAASLGTNLVRVWGGGVYESRDFYEVCDELGLLVWQDFPFACSAYPEVEPIRSEVIAEARDNVARLARHPSLVVWNGNNENIWLHDADGWGAELGDRGWGLDYYLDLLPTIVDAVDPSRFYTVASPWSGSESLPANEVDHETHHSWDVWNRLPDTAYRESVPRFVSEFGWQAPPAWRTLRDAVADAPLRVDSPGVVHHQKAADGMAKLARGLEPRFGAVDPAAFDAWHYLTQLQQAHALATEHRCRGVAAQRPVAGVVVVGDRLGGAAEAAGARAPPSVRRRAADDPSGVVGVGDAGCGRYRGCVGCVGAVGCGADWRPGSPGCVGCGRRDGRPGRARGHALAGRLARCVRVIARRGGRPVDPHRTRQRGPGAQDHHGRRDPGRGVAAGPAVGRRCRGRCPARVGRRRRRPGERAHRRGHGLAPRGVDPRPRRCDAVGAGALPDLVRGGRRRPGPDRRGRLARPRPAGAAGPGRRWWNGRPRVHDAAARRAGGVPARRCDRGRHPGAPPGARAVEPRRRPAVTGALPCTNHVRSGDRPGHPGAGELRWGHTDFRRVGRRRSPDGDQFQTKES
jgi:beta-galactosidase/beta-glucuronidase